MAAATPHDAALTRPCPHCRSHNVRRSRAHLVEWLMLALVLAFRCRDCRRRFYGFRWGKSLS
jgi:transposase-like protein